MKLKSLTLTQTSLLILSFLSLMSYEAHINKAAGVKFNQIFLLATFFIVLIIRRFKIYKVQNTLTIIFSLMILYSLFSLLGRLLTGISNSPFELIKNCLLLLNVAAITTLFSQKNTEDFFKYSFYLIVISSIISIPIILFGHFIVWHKQNLRLLSIFQDPNYYGALIGFALLYGILLWNTNNKLIKYGIITLLSLNLFMTFSKGALISLLVSLSYISYKKFPIKTTIVAITSGLMVLSLINIILEKLRIIKLLRVEMGLNRRGLYWQTATERIKENPILGYGTENVKNEILSLGYTNTSFHNYYIEQTYVNGLPFLIGIITLLVITLLKLNKSDYRFCALLLYLAVAANNFSYSIGGIGFLSILFTFVVVYSYQALEKNTNSVINKT